MHHVLIYPFSLVCIALLRWSRSCSVSWCKAPVRWICSPMRESGADYEYNHQWTGTVWAPINASSASIDSTTQTSITISHQSRRWEEHRECLCDHQLFERTHWSCSFIDSWSFAAISAISWRQQSSTPVHDWDTFNGRIIIFWDNYQRLHHQPADATKCESESEWW